MALISLSRVEIFFIDEYIDRSVYFAKRLLLPLIGLIGGYSRRSSIWPALGQCGQACSQLAARFAGAHGLTRQGNG
ncbi:MAG TPA: hypothetical protein VJ047_12895 [Pseudomonas sp.]|nr:hypothetical protein [Pseudomonas sp.]